MSVAYAAMYPCMPPVLLAQLLERSAEARVARARSAAEALCDDVVSFVRSGEVDRAREAARSHDTVFSEAVGAVLALPPGQRQSRVMDYEEEWLQRLWGIPFWGYEAVIVLAGLVSLPVALFLVGLGISLRPPDHLWLPIASNAVIAGVAMVLIRSSVRGVRRARRALASCYGGRLQRIAEAAGLGGGAERRV